MVIVIIVIRELRAGPVKCRCSFGDKASSRQGVKVKSLQNIGLMVIIRLHKGSASFVMAMAMIIVYKRCLLSVPGIVESLPEVVGNASARLAARVGHVILILDKRCY